MNDKPRKPWLAGLLTVFAIGLGHLYSGEIKKGVILYIIGQLFLVIVFSSFLVYAPVLSVITISAGFVFTVYCIYSAVTTARKYKLSYPMKKINTWYVYVVYWFVAAIVIQSVVEITVKSNISQAYKIPSGAMLQTLQVGDHVMANKMVYKISQPKRGDIVTFPFPREPSKTYIKRIVAIGGDIIELKDKALFLNGTPVEEPHAYHVDSKIFPAGENPRDNLEPITVPAGKVFVLGDNRDNSFDSRFWGFVDESSVEGKALTVYWSWDKQNSIVRWNRIGKRIE